METSQIVQPSLPRWYWVVAAVALLWNLMGCAAFSMEMFAPEVMMKEWSAEQKEWAHSIPSWIYFVYAVAVISGVAASIGLFLRKGWSGSLFVISLVAIFVQMVYTMIIAGGVKIMGPSSVVMPGLVIFIAAVLVWFARFAKGKGWLLSKATQS